MKLRDCYPKNKEEAIKLDVEFFDVETVFKIFESEDSLEGIKTATIAANFFLIANGYEEINLAKFIEDDFNYESQDAVVSLGKHGYIAGLVLFVKKEK